MKTIQLEIRQLGRIRDSKIEIMPWMIFSGDSGMGKSYLAILVHYFFELMVNPSYMDSFFKEEGINYNDSFPKLKGQGTAFVVNKNHLEKWMAKDAIRYVGYMINDKYLNADIVVNLPENIPAGIECTFEEEMIGVENNVETYIKFELPELTFRNKNTFMGLNAESPFAFFFRYYLIKEIFGDYKALEYAFVLPPSRGAVMTEEVTYISGMFKEFLIDKHFLEGAKSHQDVISPELKDLMTNVMEGKVSMGENQQYRYKMSNELNDMPLTAAASSIRELAPIQMLVDNVNISKAAVLVEEPEAHLHPEKQRLMADVLCCMNNVGTFMQVTTHSDYLLRRLNELIALKRIMMSSDDLFEKVNSETKVSKEVLPEIEKLAAYLLQRQDDGSSKAVKQDLNNGIPYTSFWEPLRQSVKIKRLIENVGNENN